MDWERVEECHKILRQSSAAGDVAEAGDKRFRRAFVEFIEEAMKVVWDEFEPDDRGELFTWMAVHTMANVLVSCADVFANFMQQLAETQGETHPKGFAGRMFGQALLTALDDAIRAGMITEEGASIIREQLQMYDPFSGSGVVTRPNNKTEENRDGHGKS